MKVLGFFNSSEDLGKSIFPPALDKLLIVEFQKLSAPSYENHDEVP